VGSGRNAPLAVGIAAASLGAATVVARSAGLAAEALATAVLLGGLAGAAAAFSTRAPWERLGLGPSGVPAALGVLLVTGILVLSHAADATIRILGIREIGSLPRIDAALTASDRPPLCWLIVALALGPAAAEELLFRGVIQRGLEAWIGPAGAILAGSLAFAAAHADPGHSVGAFGLGLYLGVLTWRTGSIRPAFYCHALNNAVVVLSMGNRIAVPGLPPWGIPVAFLAVLGVLAVFWRRVPIQARLRSADQEGGFPGHPPG